MKKTLFSFALISLSFCGFTQTITSSNIAKIGDTIYRATDVSPSINIGTTGTGNTWNFSSLLMNSKDTTIIEHPHMIYGSAGATNFPNATHAVKEDTLYLFLELSSSSLEILGVSDGTTFLKSSNTESLIKFPSTYGSTFTDNSRTTETISGASAGYPTVDSVRIISHAEINSDFNASGTLTTPFGIFSCIRQHIKRVSNDTVYAKIFGTWNPSPILAQTDTTYNHEYWSDAVNAKLSLVSYEVDKNGNFMGSLDWMTGFSANPNAGIEEFEKKSIAVFPNPASDKLTIAVEEDVKEIAVANITGKVVFKSNLVGTKSIDISRFRNGIYTVTILTDSYIGTTKFIKQ